jgi:DNA-binding transcriptional regulator YhcF (GntR family)
MEFRDNEAIYLQIAAYVGQNILLDKWRADQKIPSVRDMAVELQVNLNTVMRSYEFLESIGVIYNKRGLGFFVAAEGYEKMKAYRKEKFIQQDLPSLFNNLYLLDINQDELFTWYEQFMASNYPIKPATKHEKK